jgi:hypothetical protein
MSHYASSCASIEENTHCDCWVLGDECCDCSEVGGEEYCDLYDEDLFDDDDDDFEDYDDEDDDDYEDDDFDDEDL